MLIASSAIKNLCNAGVFVEDWLDVILLLKSKITSWVSSNSRFKQLLVAVETDDIEDDDEIDDDFDDDEADEIDENEEVVELIEASNSSRAFKKSTNFHLIFRHSKLKGIKS